MENQPIHNSVARRLRDEALSQSPPFSASLHERIMQRIREDPSRANEQTSNASLGGWRIGWAVPSLSAAAIVLITAGVWIHHTSVVKPRVPAVAVNVPSVVPKFDVHFPELTEPMTAPLTEARFGYLDRDAKSVVKYVVDHVDVIPAPPPRRG